MRPAYFGAMSTSAFGTVAPERMTRFIMACRARVSTATAGRAATFFALVVRLWVYAYTPAMRSTSTAAHARYLNRLVCMNSRIIRFTACIAAGRPA